MLNNKASIGKRIAGGLVDCLISLMIFATLSLAQSYAYSGSFWSNGPALWIGSILISAACVFLEFRYGKTPGKLICKTKVVDEKGGSITLGQSIMRNLLRCIDGAFFYAIGLVMIATSKNNQRMGDFVAKTIVIDEEKLP